MDRLVEKMDKILDQYQHDINGVNEEQPHSFQRKEWGEIRQAVIPKLISCVLSDPNIVEIDPDAKLPDIIKFLPKIGSTVPFSLECEEEARAEFKELMAGWVKRK